MNTDMEITKSDGKTVGLMLATDSNGYKIYKRYDDDKLAQQYYVGAADYGYLPPEKEFAIIQNSFEGGMGQEFWDINKPLRYFTSVGVDNRFKGNTILGPKYTGISIPQVIPVVADDSFENWDNSTTLTNWTKSNANITTTQGSSATYLRDGTYYCLLTASADAYIYQDATWNAAYQGKYVFFSCWVKVADSANSRVRLAIDDGVGTTYSDYAVSTGSTAGFWHQLWVAHPLNAAATRCRFIIDYDYIGSSTNIYVDDMHIGGSPKCVCEYGDYLFFSIGNTIWRLNATGDDIDYRGQTYGEITSLCVFDDGYMYVGCGNQSSATIGTESGMPYYYYTSPTVSLTKSTLSASVYDAYADYFLNVAGVMYKVNKPYSVYKTTNPANTGDWSLVSTIGSISENITDVAVDIETPYFGKEDTVYYIDTDDSDYPLIYDLKSLRRSDNCKNLHFWHGSLYIPCGTQGLVESSSGVISWRSPARFCTNLSSFTGQVQALTSDEEYLYAVLNNGSSVEVLAGQMREVENSTEWVWHPLQTLTLDGCEKAYVSSIYAKRLWLLSTSATDSIYYIPLTDKYGDITSDTSYTFLTGGYDITSWYHINLRADDKAFISLTLTTEGCDEDNYITVYYQTYYTALTGTWKLLGKFDESPTKTFSLLADVPTGSMIRFKRTLTTSSTSTTPKITGMDCRGVWRPDKRKLINCIVRIGDNIQNKNGTTYGSEKELREAVEEANNSKTIVKLKDISEVERKVMFLSAVQGNVKIPKEGNPEYTYELLLEELE